MGHHLSRIYGVSVHHVWLAGFLTQLCRLHAQESRSVGLSQEKQRESDGDAWGDDHNPHGPSPPAGPLDDIASDQTTNDRSAGRAKAVH